MKRCVTIRSSCSSTRSSKRSRSGCRLAGSAPAGSSCSRPGTVRANGRCPGATSWSSRARSRCSAACEGHVSPPADAGVRLCRGARARPVSARPRDLASLSVAVAAGALGVAARVRRRRSAPHLRRARRRGRVSRARGRGPRGDPGHRPEPHGGRRREPVLARPRVAADVLRRRPADGVSSPLLRRERARRGQTGGLGGLLGDACEGDRARARGRRRGGAGRPSGRSRESRRVLRPAAGRGRRARLGGKDPRARRGAPGLAGGRDDRLRVPERRARRCA